MGRPRLTAKELRMRGCAPGTPNYNRYRERLEAESESPVSAAPKVPFKPLSKRPPAHLTVKQKELWRALLEQAPKGVLSSSHAIIVEVAVLLWEKVSKGQSKPSETNQLRAILQSFQMVPGGKPVTTATAAEKQETEHEKMQREADEALASVGEAIN